MKSSINFFLIIHLPWFVPGDFMAQSLVNRKKIQALRKYTEKQNDFKIQVPAGYWEQNIKFKEIK